MTLYGLFSCLGFGSKKKKKKPTQNQLTENSLTIAKLFK